MASDQGDAPGIRHVLFDADGVIQSIPGGWFAAMEPYVGRRAQEFLHDTWKDEKPTLAGHGDYLPLLAARLIDYEASVPAEEVYRAVWQRIEPDIESLEVVRALRATGYGVHLGTNQERHRAAHMRTALGYDALFDASCYSCDLGVTKPDPASSPPSRAASEPRRRASCSSMTMPGTSRVPVPPASPQSSGTWSSATTSSARCSPATASSRTRANRSSDGTASPAQS